MEPPKELEKHLWFTIASDEIDFEVELQVTPSKVKASSCDCDDYHIQGICKHIVALMLTVRSILQEQQEKKKKKAKSNINKKLTKLSTVALLNSVNHEELKAFVRQYAKDNRNFAIALKAKFAKDVEVKDTFEKYSAILKAAVTNSKKLRGIIKAQQAKELFAVAEELLHQIDDFIYQKNYTESMAVLQAMLKHLPPCIAQTDNPEKLKAYTSKSLDRLELLANKMESVELRQQLWSFCLSEFDRPFYQVHNYDNHLLNCLFTLNLDKDQMRKVQSIIQQEFAKTNKEKRKAKLLLYQIKLLEQFNESKLIKSLIEENIEFTEILLLAISNARAEKNYKRAKQLAKSAMKKAESKEERKVLEKLLLEIALEENHKQDILVYARQCFLNNFDIKYFKTCKQHVKVGWNPFREQLLKSMEKAGYTLELRDALAKIYEIEKMPRELLDYITKIRSLVLLKNYDQFLLPHFAEEVYQLYLDLLSNYLENHIGRQTSVKVKEILQHLNAIGEHKFTDRLIQNFRIEYASRHSLIEELAVF